MKNTHTVRKQKGMIDIYNLHMQITLTNVNNINKSAKQRVQTYTAVYNVISTNSSPNLSYPY